ncbi:unnamed protein product [Caenorhabditis auriculariae]|uniref:Major facilitator superfamily (MFS) profile domain-containing protein n=1 Tax=Caenorhabditis auriculariae TaxID=2777116 RepID=A0A8S1GUP4_9PELO|nr:unnamed protein product [Caenorhabditis auriculariae]
MSAVHPVSDGLPSPPRPLTYRWFPSWRLLTASMLCLCFASVHMMNSNMGMAIVCMVNSSANYDNTSLESSAPRLDWTPDEQGYIFSAFNAGLLVMLVTGFLADKLNAKYMIVASVAIASAANFMIPVLSPYSVYYAIAGRFLVGFADALLQPAMNSLITRWFPTSERSYALGLATGGRQIGTLAIIPTAGALCSQTVLFGGWPSIFYLSGFVGIVFIVFYSILGADKPSKQTCISDAELKFITIANQNEDVGKKRTERKVPWMRILESGAVWASVISLVCHELPLMTMIMFLPSYLHDVHHYDSTENGILSALPTLSLWIAKMGSSYANTWLQKNTAWKKDTICKVLNSIGSVGLGFFLIAATWLDSSHAWMAVLFLCLSMASAGLHTPGCQLALVSVAPAYSGAVTGFTFFFVAVSGIIHPIVTKMIVQERTASEWNLVFYISAAIAVFPIVIFNVWGSTEVQWWAKSTASQQKEQKIKEKTAPELESHGSCDSIA